MKRCPKCQTQFPDEANFCPKDAGRLVPDTEAAGSSSAAPNSASDTTADGLLGGRFKLGERLGGDRTGEVYEATDSADSDSNGASCVVKLVKAAVFPSPMALQRTERELKQLARLRAPGVRRVSAHGRDQGRLWIAGEPVSGTSLEKLVASGGPLPLERATAIVLAVGKALGESAKAGVIHRDLSPKNILVNEATDDGVVVTLINFCVPVPGDGGLQGVAEFVSPEQVDGKPVDQRSNIYSLAAVYYFALTGRAPFVGDAQAVLEQHRSAAPVAPSTLAAVPAAVDALVLKALEKSSSKRFMTLRQMLEQVARAAEGEAASTQPMGRAGGEAAGRSGKRNKAAAATMMGGFAEMPSSVSGELPRVSGPAGLAASAASASAAPAVTTPVTPTTPMSTREANVAATAASQVDELIEPAAPVVVAPVAAAAPPVAVAAAPAPAAAAVVSGGNGVAGKGKGKGKAKSQRSAARSRKNKGRFRETMWFKKGDLDAAAAEEAASAKNGALVSDKADQLPMEDRYGDDGSISNKDQQSYSLRTGHTQAMAAMPGADSDAGASVPKAARGAGVSEDELIGEMKGGRGKIIAAIVIGLVLIVAVVVLSTR